MPRLTRDIIRTQQQARLFIQPGGPGPLNPVQYGGLDAQYMILDGVTKPLRGTIEPTRVPHPSRIKQFKTVGRRASAPDLPTATLHLLERHGYIPSALGAMACPFNLYSVAGKCEGQNLSDFLAGWEDFVEVYSLAEATQVDGGDRTAWEDDNQIEDALALTLASIYAIGPLQIAAQADPLIDREVVDVVYASGVECGSCGVPDDGTKKAFALVQASGAGSPGLPAEVIYTLDGGVTWTEVNIDGLGATETVYAIDIVGNKLVVLGEDAYFWAVLDRDTGEPGAFTEVTAGFIGAGSPVDLYVLSPREVFFVGDGGYIYRATDITAGVVVMDAGVATSENLLRVHGDGDETLVAVGENDAVVRSLDRGATWGPTEDATPSGVGADLGAVAVKTETEFWIGTLATGQVFYTVNGGKSWIAQAIPDTGAGSVRDIIFATEEVGYILYDKTHIALADVAFILCTWNGGRDWVRNDGGSKRVLNWPVFDRGNRIAVPQADEQTSAGHILIAGLAGDGEDGLLLLGETPEL